VLPRSSDAEAFANTLRFKARLVALEAGGNRLENFLHTDTAQAPHLQQLVNPCKAIN